jgi:hypothetical protein
MDLKQILDIIGSKGGQTAIGAVGAGLSAAGQAKQNDRQMNMTANQYAASMAQRQLESQQDDERARASQVLSQRPLGESENYIQKQMLMKAILGGVSNSNIRPTDKAIAAQTPSGGGGFDLSSLNGVADRAFTDDSIMRAINQRDKDVLNVSPYSAQSSMAAFGDAAQPYSDDVNAYALDAQQRMAEPRMSASEKIQAALDRDLQAAEKKKGSGFWKKLGKIAAFAAPIVAAPFTGGASLALIGAGAGAAGGLLNGGGLKGALMGGALGASPGIGGAGKVASAGGNVLRSTALNAAANSIPMAAKQTAGSIAQQMAKQAGTKLLASGGRL